MKKYTQTGGQNFIAMTTLLVFLPASARAGIILPTFDQSKAAKRFGAGVELHSRVMDQNHL